MIDIDAEPDLLHFLHEIEEAQKLFAKGDPAPFKRLWHQDGNVTLSGGLGGQIAIGWEEVSQRLDWASSNYAEGERSWHRLAGRRSGNMAYLVQKEIIEAKISGSHTQKRQELRATMVFGFFSGRWLILHRHADSQAK